MMSYMIFHPPLIHAILEKREKRFLAHVTLDNGKKVIAHCANTGSMTSCYAEGASVYLSQSNNPKRKLAYTWELSQVQQGYVGVNTQLTNTLVKEALEQRRIPRFATYTHIQQEVCYKDQGRLDFYLCSSTENTLCNQEDRGVYIEAKNATLYHKKWDAVIFPDAPTVRGRKHLKILTQIAEKERQYAALLFVINRPEGSVFRPAHHIDPEYAALLNIAQKSGVELYAYRTIADPPTSVILSSQMLPIDLSMNG